MKPGIGWNACCTGRFVEFWNSDIWNCGWFFLVLFFLSPWILSVCLRYCPICHFMCFKCLLWTPCFGVTCDSPKWLLLSCYRDHDCQFIIRLLKLYNTQGTHSQCQLGKQKIHSVSYSMLCPCLRWYWTRSSINFVICSHFSLGQWAIIQ